tara:strand:- start:10489 stop:11613 length:1125 start_codon:yes stop_codon:yes gene_type:complete
MNIQHPLLSKIDINNIHNIDSAVESIKKLGLKCKVHNDSIIVKYPKNFKFSNDNYVRKSRGIIIDFTNKKIINRSIEGCIDYSKFKSQFPLEEIVIEDCIDGTLINVYYNDKWCVSTKFCVNADEAKFRNSKTFRQLFDSISGNFYNDLDKSYTYSFLLQHNECRNVSMITRNKLYHLESTNNVTGEKVQIKIPGIDTPNILKFGQYENLNKLKAKSYEELEDIVNNMNWNKPGIMLYTSDRNYRAKLTNKNFENISNLVKDQNNVDFIVIKSMYCKKNLPELLKYFPEYGPNAVKINNLMIDYTTKLHDLYIKCKVKSTYCDLEKKYKKTICDLHNLYKFERTQGNNSFKVTYNVVCNIVRTYDAAFIYTLLM